jgi:hypothetical protein
MGGGLSELLMPFMQAAIMLKVSILVREALFFFP